MTSSVGGTQTTLRPNQRRRRIAGERREATSSVRTPPPVSAPRRRGLIFSGAAGLALVTIAAACWLGLQTWSYPDVRAAERSARAGSAASVAAERAVPAILSFDHTRLDADLAKATAYMTPAFARTYTGSFDSLARPNATRTKATVTAKVLATAVVTASESHAQILVFVDQTTVSTANRDAPSVALNRATFDLVKQGGRWLVEGFEPY